MFPLMTQCPESPSTSRPCLGLAAPRPPWRLPLCKRVSHPDFPACSSAAGRTMGLGNASARGREGSQRPWQPLHATNRKQRGVVVTCSRSRSKWVAEELVSTWGGGGGAFCPIKQDLWQPSSRMTATGGERQQRTSLTVLPPVSSVGHQGRELQITERPGPTLLPSMGAGSG